MNEFLQQFVVESRELVGQAVEGLLKLERSPRDADGLDGVFRAFHTLKGGAGIVEFSAMERSVHAAEEVLGEARSGQRVISTALVSRCLACLDQVGLWLDAIAGSGTLPAADREADLIVRSFAGADADAPGVAPSTSSAQASADDWLDSLCRRHRLPEAAVTAIRYTPSVDCFFQGEDPGARVAALPRLLAQELLPVNAWPSLSELDPYTCNLVLTALSAAPLESVRAHMQGFVGRCDIVDVRRATRGNELLAPQDHVRALLESQRALLAEERAGPLPAGLIAAAGRVAVNVLQAMSRQDEIRHVQEATEQSLREDSPRALTRVLEQLLVPPPDSTKAPELASARPAETTLRVDTARIDALVRLTGEFTTAKNALAHTASRAQGEHAALAGSLRERLTEFERLTERLQHAVLALRVLPLRTVLQRLPRVVREISSAVSKPVVLQIEGDHTEADKSIVDILFEPLLHTLRNAIDHGVEVPARRLELDKPLVATIRIHARRESDRVLIDVADDGSGVNVERVREVALQRKLVTPEVLRGMSEAETVDLIFAPGFSTTTTVTELSGRGVGLDAVRSAVQRVGGQVSLASRPGQGTTFTFSLPFSVMVTQVLTVEAGGQTFGIPLDALVETFRVKRQFVSGVGAARVIVHRDRTIPLIDLGAELGGAVAADSLDLSEVTVALASFSDERVALRVDRVGERMEVILKPLEGLLANMKGIAGTTLLGDGRVLLVLDVWDLWT